MSVSTPESGPRSAPPPGQAPLVSPNAAALLRRNAQEFGDRVAIRFGDAEWTHGEYYAESVRFAALFAERLPETGPRHVAVLLDNTPDYLFAFGGAAGAALGLQAAHRPVGVAVAAGGRAARGQRLVLARAASRWAASDDPRFWATSYQCRAIATSGAMP